MKQKCRSSIKKTRPIPCLIFCGPWHRQWWAVITELLVIMCSLSTACNIEYSQCFANYSSSPTFGYWKYCGCSGYRETVGLPALIYEHNARLARVGRVWTFSGKGTVPAAPTAPVAITMNTYYCYLHMIIVPSRLYCANSLPTATCSSISSVSLQTKRGAFKFQTLCIIFLWNSLQQRQQLKETLTASWQVQDDRTETKD